MTPTLATILFSFSLSVLFCCLSCMLSLLSYTVSLVHAVPPLSYFLPHAAVSSRLIVDSLLFNSILVVESWK